VSSTPIHRTDFDLGAIESLSDDEDPPVVEFAGYLTDLAADRRLECELDTLLDGLEKS
jgi:hypothetical protein